jgi:hypothetical protein
VTVLLVFGLRSIGSMGVEVRELQLTFVDDKAVVQLPMLNDEFATHLCVSTLAPDLSLTFSIDWMQRILHAHIAGTFRTTGGTRRSSAVCSGAFC